MDAISFATHLTDFMDETDRAAIVLAASHIDTLLQGILEKRLVGSSKELFDHNGPFGTFSAKILTCYAIGIIDKDFRDKLNLVRRLRNECAHNIDRVDLEADRFQTIIANLSQNWLGTEFWDKSVDEAQKLTKKTPSQCRLRVAIAYIIANLALIEERIERIDATSAHRLLRP